MAMFGGVTQVKIAALRNNVSRYVRRARSGESIVILDRSKPVAVLGPCPNRSRGALLGGMKGTAAIRGDIVDPVIPEREWFRA